MAITVINSQNMQLLVATTVLTTPDYDDFTTAKTVGCPQSLGTIEQTRTVTEYKCMSSDESAKALGSITRGNLEVGLLFDPDDAAGQGELKTAFAANTDFLFGIELPDGTFPRGTAANGTTFAFIGKISAVAIGIEQDAAITYTLTIEISSDVTEIEKDTAT